jgi:hypothetical protein
MTISRRYREARADHAKAGGNFSCGRPHYLSMDCRSAREAISAQIDGEDPGWGADVLRAHLASCADCRDWQQRAYTVTRRARLGCCFLDHDLAPAVLAAVSVEPRSGSRPALIDTRAVSQ